MNRLDSLRAVFEEDAERATVPASVADQAVSQVAAARRRRRAVVVGLSAIAVVVPLGIVIRTADSQEAVDPQEPTEASLPWAGLASCGAPHDPVGAFWANDVGVGYPGSSEQAPTGGDIWLIDADGQVSAATNDGLSRDPLLSRDGQRLYFTRAVASSGFAEPLPGLQIWVRDLTTGSEAMLAATGPVDDLAESPDGTSLAFTTVDTEGQRRLFTMDAAGDTTPEVVPWSGAGDSHDEQTSPSWSPDGTQIAYISRSYSDDGLLFSSIRVLDPTSGKETVVYQAAEEVVLYDLAWLSDNESLLVTKTLRGGVLPGTVIRVDRLTGSEAVVAEGAGVAAVAASEDGSTVAEIGWPVDRIGEGNLLPSLTTWTHGQRTDIELPRRFAFATDLTIAECAYLAP
jgi:WD40 repeat protein